MWVVWAALAGCTDLTTEGTDQTAPTDNTDVAGTETASSGTDTGTDTTEVCGPDAVTGVDEGFCAPDFTLPDRDGTLITLSDSRGKVLLVDLVALWCHSCYELAPALERVREAYHDDGFEVFTMVAQDVSGNAAGIEHAAQWADKLKVTSPVVADTTGKAQWEWTRNPTQVVIPMTYIIDEDGVIQWFGAGDHLAPRMEEVVTDLLGVANQGVANDDGTSSK